MHTPIWKKESLLSIAKNFQALPFKDEEVHEGNIISHHTPYIVTAILVHYSTFCLQKCPKQSHIVVSMDDKNYSEKYKKLFFFK